ncbi:unnamed protein product [Spirodela intermedia]|uniref:NAC domain-containing protein n=2 Tax=Spirodela intermedia TaxID=51605 RepID=A0A7I8IJ84_SPIIN|nr:unnamed protein product [Spirodela intermedia]CAA6657550.1 unnamed protein product [Spirodela intermedia]CAA7393628.1 unnamed protein product [Spirodela intermedia]
MDLIALKFSYEFDCNISNYRLLGRRSLYAMSPLASTPSSIEHDWTDEKIFLFLGAWKCGDPLPSNVITDVNPFSIEPWNAPENIWYLCILQESTAAKGEARVENTPNGYWKNMQRDFKIILDSQTTGMKATWGFFRYTAPHNHNVRWIMFEYNLKTKECETVNQPQNFKTLYRVIGSNNLLPVSEDAHTLVSLGDDDCDHMQSVLLSMLEREEGDIDLLEPADGSEGSMAISNRSLEDSRANHLAEVPVDFDFSNGDFLELKDLNDTDSSSSSSDNSSRVSLSSDDYFDSEALLRDLKNESNPAVEAHSHSECKPCISRSLRTNSMTINLHPQKPARLPSPTSPLSEQYQGTDSNPQRPGTSQGSPANRGNDRPQTGIMRAVWKHRRGYSSSLARQNFVRNPREKRMAVDWMPRGATG